LELSVYSEVSSPDNQIKKDAPSFFAEALPILNTRKLSHMQKRIQLKMAVNNFLNNFKSYGLSENYQELRQHIQDTEIQTRLRRAQPLYTNEVLGDSYQYGGKQLERKAQRNLSDFGISIEGKSLEEMAIEYKNLVETLLEKPDLVLRKDGTLNKQEPTINIQDPETLAIVAF